MTAHFSVILRPGARGTFFELQLQWTLLWLIIRYHPPHGARSPQGQVHLQSSLPPLYTTLWVPGTWCFLLGQSQAHSPGLNNISLGPSSSGILLCPSEVGDSGPLGSHLVFVKWNKIQALFSPRHSRTKLVIKAELCESKEIRCPLLRSRKTSLSACAQEGSLRVKKGPHPRVSMDMHPQSSGVGSILEKFTHASWGESMDQSGVKKERR